MKKKMPETVVNQEYQYKPGRFCSIEQLYYDKRQKHGAQNSHPAYKAVKDAVGRLKIFSGASRDQAGADSFTSPYIASIQPAVFALLP